MSEAAISFFFTAGASTWIFAKLQNQSGNNTKQSLIATTFIAVFTFFVFFSILKMIF